MVASVRISIMITLHLPNRPCTLLDPGKYVVYSDNRLVDAGYAGLDGKEIKVCPVHNGSMLSKT